MVLHTANGSINARTECPIFVAGINKTISTYVLEDTPDVLPPGRRCVDEGFTFHWDAYLTRPTWTLQNGHIITPSTEGYIPHLGADQRPAGRTTTIFFKTLRQWCLWCRGWTSQ